MAQYSFNDYIKVPVKDKDKVVKKLIGWLPDSYFHMKEEIEEKCAKQIKDGYLHIQLWEFMHIFGPLYFNGSEEVGKLFDGSLFTIE